MTLYKFKGMTELINRLYEKRKREYIDIETLLKQATNPMEFY